MSKLDSLPSEIIAGVAIHLGYEETQALRLVCRHIDGAIQYLALTKMTLDFIQPRLYESQIPFEMIEAYTTPGYTAAFGHVRHLTVRHVCVSPTGANEQLDRINVDPCTMEYDFSDKCYSLKNEHRFRATLTLLRNMICGDGLKNLETVKCVEKSTYLNPDKLITFNLGGSYDGVVSIHLVTMLVGADYNEPTECQGFIDMFAMLLRSRGPLQRLEVLACKNSILRRMSLGLPCIPSCKQLVITGLSEPLLPDMPVDTLHYPWVEKVISECPELEWIDADCRFNRTRFDHRFPPPLPASEGVPSLTSPGKLLYASLFLEPGAYDIPSRAINQFRYLQNVDIGYPDITQDFWFAIASIWSVLAAEHIYVKHISVFVESVGFELVDYISSYPSPYLKTLCIWTHPNEETFCLPGVVDDFYARGFPVVASGLKQLSLKMYFENEWCMTLERFMSLKSCVSLEEVSVTMSASDHKGFTVMGVIRNTFDHPHTQLKNVGIIDIVDNDDILPMFRYAEYDVDFVRHRLDVYWKDHCKQWIFIPWF